MKIFKKGLLYFNENIYKKVYYILMTKLQLNTRVQHLYVIQLKVYRTLILCILHSDTLVEPNIHR